MSLFDDDEPIGTGEVITLPARKPLESLKQYSERTGVPLEVKTKRTRNIKHYDNQEEYPVEIHKTEEDLMSDAKRMLCFMQSDDKVVKFLCTELGYDSVNAENEVRKMRGEIRMDFQRYITTCSEDNIIALREILKLALERNDSRNATEVLKNLDNMTNNYLIDNGLKQKQEKTEEVEILFT